MIYIVVDVIVITRLVDFAMISKSVNNVLYFAGEHTCRDRGSVHGAYLSGMRVAKEVWDHDDDDD
jgi:monoamine oxidase